MLFGPGVGQGIGATDALAIARQHMGEDEIRDEGKLSRWFQSRNINISPRTTAWCAAFVNASLHQAGIKGNVQPGDIVVYPHHVGFATGRTQDGQVEVLGGNQGGAVSGRGGVSQSFRVAGEIRRPPMDTQIAARRDADRAAQSQSISRTSKVELGKGRIDVNVMAPPGTKTKASGNKLLDLPLSQTSQMQNAGARETDANQYSEE